MTATPATPATQKRRSPKPLGSAHCPTPATQRGGAPRDARAYIRPLGSAHCPTPNTQKRRSPKGRQGVHPTPWQCTLSHACHAKEAEPQGRQGVHPTPWHTSEKCTVSHACHDIRPLAMHIVPRLPRKRGGAPRDARAYIQPLGSAHGPTPATQKRRRAYIRPLGSAHCPTPATQKTRSPKGRQGVHPTPWQCTLSHACHAKAAEPRRDARVYIRPLGSAHCPTPATQKRRSPKGRQGVHPTPWQCTLSHACYAKKAEPEETPGRTSDPLAVHIVPRLPRKKRGAPRDARAHPTPWQCTLSHACHAKGRSPKGCQGVHPTPWECTLSTLSHACLAREAEPQGTPGRTSDPLAVHIVPRLPRKSGGE